VIALTRAMAVDTRRRHQGQLHRAWTAVNARRRGRDDRAETGEQEVSSVLENEGTGWDVAQRRLHASDEAGT